MKGKRQNDILGNISTNIKKDSTNINNILIAKIEYIQEIIRNTLLSIKQNKTEEIFSNNDSVLSTSILIELYDKTDTLQQTLISRTCNTDEVIEKLQQIINKLSVLICGFGTTYVEDLLFISFGSEFKNTQTPNHILQCKYNLIKKYIRPLGYKIMHWNKNKTTYTHKNILCENKITEDEINIQEYNTLECFDIESGNESFLHKVYGIRTIMHNEKARKTIVINGILDDIHIDCITNDYIKHRKEELNNLIIGRQNIEKNLIENIINNITFKDIMIYGNDDIIKKAITILFDVKSIKHNKLEKTITSFLEMDMFMKRNMLINLLLCDKDNDIQYISYILYEILSVDSSDNHKCEQTIIYNSLPWKIKTNFKEVIKETIRSANDMMHKYDVTQITLEQQIYLMKADDNVKEKAILKLKEIKGKPDEMTLKAKQYIEGLLKIPFNIYREEPSLKQLKNINNWFIRILIVVKSLLPEFEFTEKENYTLLEINHSIKFIKQYTSKNILQIIKRMSENMNIKQLNLMIQKINTHKKSVKERRLSITNQTKSSQINNICNFITNIANTDNLILYELFDMVVNDNTISLVNVKNELQLLSSQILKVQDNINTISKILDDSIYAHTHAKNQIMKIIGQWMSGEQSGYCFGFEGSPGIGKTSLAKKGISRCLMDENNEPRPFSFIALGGSCNGSTLEGHSYTYMNSTWGRIVEILMESKCMNPIIYIDELDKVSKTENGREIIGIFTHLIDQTQNDSFQDKYFSGINIDLSKVLFIFSYNDPEQIDKILLDRIHRIKFSNLTTDDKIIIVNRFILPEINKKMGFSNIVNISNEMIEYIIDKYTLEPGVRKLKELLFDLYGEINLYILKNNDEDIELPIEVTPENLETKYLPKYHKISERRIHPSPIIGTINGLWANALGRGGIIPIQTMFYPTSNFLDLRLTGLQGDVMKESMNVAKSLAWNLIPNTLKKSLITEFTDTKCQGLHIHCPEGSISKDGPSAGTAITTAIYSLFIQKHIPNTIAITGEITLQGEITAIGGLDMKIAGGIKAGIKTFIYPKENARDYNEWKSKNNDIAIKDLQFYEVSTIQEVFKIVFT
jgi:ATP-dependent Lon protease